MTSSSSSTTDADSDALPIPLPITIEQVDAAIAVARRGHPRLIATPERAAALRAAVPTSGAGILATAALHGAEQVLQLPPLHYEMEGCRLLAVSREALRRLTLLGVAYLRSSDSRFVERAEIELQAVCAFADWNPSHYLDTAEMALAVALAYDWMHAALSPAARQCARQGLISHAFGTAFPPAGSWWPQSVNNWGQVCHAGLAAAAIALLDDEPQTCRRIIHRAVNNVQLAAACYAPDGDYPEGPIYWDYGTSFHVVLLELLRSALNNDFALNSMPGFMNSAASVLHLTGPTGMLYGFADGSSSRRCFATMLWFDAERGVCLPAAARERMFVEQALPMQCRLDPLATFWANDLSQPEAAATTPLRRDHCGRGSQPIVTMRSCWDDADAWYLGVKGGSPQGPHGHMDGGSFILEAQGQRWVIDLGNEHYPKIESLGMNLWSMDQQSDRWRIFRLSTAAHSVIRIDAAEQRACGNAEMVAFDDDDINPGCEWDLTTLYPAAQQVRRRFDLPGRASLCVSDTISGLSAGSRLSWSFATRAAAELTSDNARLLRLHQGGKTMRVSVETDSGGAWKAIDAQTLLQPHDSPLPDVTIIVFELATPPCGCVGLKVHFDTET